MNVDIFILRRNPEHESYWKDTFPTAKFIGSDITAEELTQITRSTMSKYFAIVDGDIMIEEGFTAPLMDMDKTSVYSWRNGLLKVYPRRAVKKDPELYASFGVDVVDMGNDGVIIEEEMADMTDCWEFFDTPEEGFENATGDYFYVIDKDYTVTRGFKGSYTPPTQAEGHPITFRCRSEESGHIEQYGHLRLYPRVLKSEVEFHVADKIYAESKFYATAKKIYHFDGETAPHDFIIPAGNTVHIWRGVFPEFETYRTLEEGFAKSSNSHFWVMREGSEFLEDFPKKFFYCDKRDYWWKRDEWHVDRHVAFRTLCPTNNMTYEANDCSIFAVNDPSATAFYRDEVAATCEKKDSIIFISYNEENADENFALLQEKYPHAKRVHGVIGIHDAHYEAAKIADTQHMFIIDGDAILADDFDLYDYDGIEHLHREGVYVWRSQNAANDLVYGYGGVKLLPVKNVLELDQYGTDFTMSLSKIFVPIKIVSNHSIFNTSVYSAWRSGFREAAKLGACSVNNPDDHDAKRRLQVWCNYHNDSEYASVAMDGARMGRRFGEKYATMPDALHRINNYKWLLKEFKEYENRI